MSDQAGHSAGDVLYVEAKFHGTEAAIILVGEFDMTGTERFWVLSAKYSGPARDPSRSRPAD